MASHLVEKPVLKAIALQFLLAHAEQPSLLQSAREPILRKWAKKKPFYEEFIQTVQQKVGYTEQKLMNSKSFIPDADFKAILDCFKQVSGLYNPAYYTVLGRIVPSIGDAVTQLASMAAGPGGVINLSPRYNNDFNNDQEIVIEQITKQNGLVEATIQHYFLPRPANNPAYLEKVTAALGYWEGIPSLWGYPIFGETKLNEVQIPLEQLVKQDYAYLNLTFEEKEGQIYVNKQHIGRRLKLTTELPELNTALRQEFLEHNLENYFPIEIISDFIVDNETIFPKNVRYGMPCNRYTVRIPEVSLGRKLTLIFDRLWQSFFSSPQEQNRIKVHRSLASALSETMYTAQHAEEERLLALAEAEKQRADAAEAKLMLEQTVSATNQIFSQMRTLAHDSKNYALALHATVCNLLRESLFQLPDEVQQRYQHIFETNEALADGIQQLKREFSPLDVPFDTSDVGSQKRLLFPPPSLERTLLSLSPLLTEQEGTLEKKRDNLGQFCNDMRTLAYDSQKYTLTLRTQVCELLRESLHQLPGDLQQKYQNMFENDDVLTESLQQMKQEISLPNEIKPAIIAADNYFHFVQYNLYVVKYIENVLGVLDNIITNERQVMAGGIPLDIKEIPYENVIKHVVNSVKPIYPQVTIQYNTPDLHINADERLFKIALMNIINNAVEASLPDGKVKIDISQKKRGDRTFTIMELYQSGYLPQNIAERLNNAEKFTTKEKGNATGAAASYNIITGPHNGQLRYESLGQNQEYGGKIRIVI